MLDDIFGADSSFFVGVELLEGSFLGVELLLLDREVLFAGLDLFARRNVEAAVDSLIHNRAGAEGIKTTLIHGSVILL